MPNGTSPTLLGDQDLELQPVRMKKQETIPYTPQLKSLSVPSSLLILAAFPNQGAEVKARKATEGLQRDFLQHSQVPEEAAAELGDVNKRDEIT